MSPALLPEVYRCAKDAQLAAQLSSEREVQLALKKLETLGSGYGFIARRGLLTDALRLTRAMAPEIADSIAHCRAVLGFDEPVEVFVRPDPLFNASAMRSTGAGPHVVVLSSRLLEAFTPGELRFVLGHELGHLKLQHFTLPMPALAGVEDLAGTILGRPNALRAFVWARAAEISADRAGLVCGGDPEAAASGFFKLASGLSSPRIRADLEAYAKQLDALGAAPKARGTLDVDRERAVLDCFSSHPYNPIRVRALLAFFRSKRFHQATGHGPNLLDDRALEATVDADLALMEPSYLEEKGERADTLRAALFAGGVVVANADGEVHPKEVQALRSLLGHERTEVAPSGADAQAKFDALVPALLESPLSQRAQLVQHLVVVSAADGVIDPREVGALEKLAGALHVDAVVVQQTLFAASHPLD